MYLHAKYEALKRSRQEKLQKAPQDFGQGQQASHVHGPQASGQDELEYDGAAS